MPRTAVIFAAVERTTLDVIEPDVAPQIRVAVAEVGVSSGVAAETDVASSRWRELTPPPARGVETVRVEASDLRRAQRIGAQIRAGAAVDGRKASVVLDIEVVVDDDAPAARRRLAAAVDTGNEGSPKTVRYVGTANGLAGLIEDVYVLGIADGVALIPFAGQDQASGDFDLVVRLLQQKGLLTA